MSLTDQQIKDILISYIIHLEKAKLALLFEATRGVKESLTSYVKERYYPHASRDNFIREALNELTNRKLLSYQTYSGYTPSSDDVKYAVQSMEAIIEPILRLRWGRGEIISQLRQREVSYIVSKLMFQYGGGAYRQEFEEELRDEAGRGTGFGEFYREPDEARERASYLLSTLIKEGFIVQKGQTISISDDLLDDLLYGSKTPREFYQRFSEIYSELLLLKSFDLTEFRRVLAESEELPQNFRDQMARSLDSFSKRRYDESLRYIGDALDELGDYLQVKIYGKSAERRKEAIRIIETLWSEKPVLPETIDEEKWRNLPRFLAASMLIPLWLRHKMGGHVPEVTGLRPTVDAARLALSCILLTLKIMREIGFLK